MQKLSYNISKEYCSDWTVYNAIREFAQNALDASHCKFGINKKAIAIESGPETLSPADFSLGKSTKTSHHIGKYGEGFKIAMLVLTRAGLQPSIWSGNMVVTAGFETHEFTGESSLVLYIKTVEEKYDGVLFASLAPDDIEELKRQVTHFSDSPRPKVSTVELIKEEQGNIYVNGLFVCNEPKLSYSYNFGPTELELNRDRNVALNIYSTLGELLVKELSASKLFKLIEEECQDVSWCWLYLHGEPELRAELTRLFFNKYGEGAKIAKSTGFYSTHSGVVCGQDRYRTYRNLNIEEVTPQLNPKSPAGQLTKFLENNKKHMRRSAIVAFNNLITGAKGWYN